MLFFREIHDTNISTYRHNLTRSSTGSNNVAIVDGLFICVYWSWVNKVWTRRRRGTGCGKYLKMVIWLS